MKILSFPGFNFDGSANVPDADQFTAFGIAPSSEVDTCIVGGQLLGPCAVVPSSSKLEAVRAPRSPLASFARGDQVGQTLALVCYEKCDVSVPPGPRAMTRVSRYLTTGEWGATALTAGRALRLPFSGRRHGMFSVKRSLNETSGDTNLVVRGVRYVDREQFRKNSALKPFVEEKLDTVWGGAGAQPVSTVEATTALGRMVYFGGYDNAEAFDEVELYVWGADQTQGDIYCVGEAWGERVL